METRRQKMENDASLRTFLLKKKQMKNSRCINVEKASPYWRISFLNKIKREMGVPLGKPNIWDRYKRGDFKSVDDIFEIFKQIPLHKSIIEMYTRIKDFKEGIILTGVRFKSVQLSPMINVIDTYNYFMEMGQRDLIEFGYIDYDSKSNYIYKIGYIPSVNRFVIMKDYYISVSFYSLTFSYKYAKKLLKLEELIKDAFLVSSISSINVVNITNGQHLVNKKIKYKKSNYDLHDYYTRDDY